MRRSYGVVLWELLTGETPYRGMNEVAVAYGVGANKLRLPLPSTCPAPIRELIEACWAPAAEARPSFAQLIERIDRIEQSGELELFAQGFLSLQTDWRLEIEAMFSDLRSKEDVRYALLSSLFRIRCLLPAGPLSSFAYHIRILLDFISPRARSRGCC